MPAQNHIDAVLSAEAFAALEAISAHTGKSLADLVEMMLGFYEPYIIDAAVVLRDLEPIRAGFQAALQRHMTAVETLGAEEQMMLFVDAVADTLAAVERLRLRHLTPGVDCSALPMAHA